MNVGFDGTAFYGAALANPATPIDRIRDVSVEISSGDAESKDRASAWTERLTAMREGSATFGLTYDGANTAQIALLTNIMARTVTSLKFLDATAGKGIYGDFVLTSFKRTFPLEGSASVEVKADMAKKPTLVTA